jgi:hypothetical protein
VSALSPRMQSISQIGEPAEAEGETIRTAISRLAKERGGECFLIDPQRDEAVSFELRKHGHWFDDGRI